MLAPYARAKGAKLVSITADSTSECGQRPRCTAAALRLGLSHVCPVRQAGQACRLPLPPPLAR